MPDTIRLSREEDGTAAIEFAFVVPLMMILIGGFLEMGYLSFARSTLESSILEAARSSRVLDCPTDQADAIRDGLEARMADVSSADGEPPVLVVQAYGENFGDVDNPEPFDDADSNGVFDEGETYTDLNGNGEWDIDVGDEGNFGDIGEVVQFSASYNVPSLFPYFANVINDGRDFYTIRATTVIRNEPASSDTCA